MCEIKRVEALLKIDKNVVTTFIVHIVHICIMHLH